MSATTIASPLPVSLVHHETIGGHTIANHVGKTDSWLQQRLVAEPSIPYASTFPDTQTAERAVNEALQANLSAFSAWLHSSAKALAPFDHDLGATIGHILARPGPPANNSLPSTKVRVIVVRLAGVASGAAFVVKTAFPIV